ncbi:cytosolic 5'-nucleotidase 1A [Takifugu rubripes]|uniref:Cytosolic 5'-nucleotidase 1A-like n=1 Tax=Takifugu rubripes TaxID=31033 RepID=A0A3B5KHI2_TAKRU|nr:cytosolic 5'-nucleotidase 1A-like [Takifugu rubripes]|eukprot:XP_011605720.1 PREDICTED: cytosolic 5'-nucleotidase 1A-like [Takifugu rubripes]
MVFTIPNTDVPQKDADRATVVAVTSRAVFELDESDDVCRLGVAHPLLQALQRVNECLLEKNPNESLLFDVILMISDSQQQQQRSRIISSTRHHGLQVSKFCFCSEDNLVEGLLQNQVHLFLTTDINEVQRVSHKGVLSGLLDQEQTFCPSDQLRVMICGDAILQPNSRQQYLQSFLAHIGEMRQRFDFFNAPLAIVLVTPHGGRDSCSSALKRLRSHGVNVDEAYCLAGAPRGPIMSVLRPHFLLNDGVDSLEEL